ncbi:hypothetical protein CkaCkLH20_12834 [Colletotrichum karsti]|uniref:Uncharacterized protein n=1 Tax=Colletotrichum karsti TaxID=1095194 RepID=A0A9P6HTW2_9PEZI|nr:uncharacterized protein CkaCkLH20_12834 [Colletotrichum karsti]KAF9869647.1 hypothetical protein CkaCkLH20_12834 [Colletotrichum karsti]
MGRLKNEREPFSRGQNRRRDSFTPSSSGTPNLVSTSLHDLKGSVNRPVSRHGLLGSGSPSPEASASAASLSPRPLVVPVPTPTSVPESDSPASGSGSGSGPTPPSLAPSPLPAPTPTPASASPAATLIPDHRGCPTCALHRLQRNHTSVWHAPGGTRSIIQLVVQHARRPWERPTLMDEINMRRVCSLVNQYVNCTTSQRIMALELCDDCEERYLFEMD